jgi:hypothetical protein
LNNSSLAADEVLLVVQGSGDEITKWISDGVEAKKFKNILEIFVQDRLDGIVDTFHPVVIDFKFEEI